MTTNGPMMTNGDVAIEDKGEGVYTMYEEVVAQIAIMKKRPPADVKEIIFFLSRDILPLIRDLAYYARENRNDIDELMVDEEDKAASYGTQFTHEDAVRFDLVLQFAKGIAAKMLENPEIADRDRVKIIAATAEECLLTVEETTLPADDEEENEEESAAPAATVQGSP